MILDGKKISQGIYDSLSEKIKTLDKKPSLGVILAGESPASLRYIGQKEKFARQVGMDFELKSFPKNVKEEVILNQISEWNNSQSISGYIVQLPLPQHIDEQKIISAIHPEKDVDGFHPVNQGKLMIGDNSGLLPCTPAGIMEILRSYNISLKGKNVCVLGRSNIVGKPVALLCVNAGATVTVCNSATKNISNFTRQADIIITATGQAHILTADMVQSDSIIIDVGFSVVDGKILGDTDANACLKKGISITPVPGGVGPMTVAMLLSNTFTAYNNEKKG